MRLFYIDSGGYSHSHLDSNIIHTFEQLEQKIDFFSFQSFIFGRDSIGQLIPKIQSFKPDVIITLRGKNLSVSIVNRLKILGAPVGLWVVDDPYMVSTHIKRVRPYDFIITQDFSCLPYYRRFKKPCIYLPTAVNPEKYRPMNVPGKYRYDICFVGTGLPARLKYFDQMVPFLLKKKFIIIGQWWERLKHYNLLRPHIINHTIPPEETAKYYNGTKVVLNIHRSNNDIQQNPLNIPAYTPNNRTFDIAACRSFQLVSYRRGLDQFYELNKEMVSFKGVNELKQKIHYYLTHDQERKQIAAQAYQRTLKDHTYEARLQHLIHLLLGRLRKRKRLSQ